MDRRQDTRDVAFPEQLNFNVALRILTVDGSRSDTARLAGALAGMRAVRETMVDHATAINTDRARSLLDRMNPNLIFIDVCTVGANPSEAYEFVAEVRKTRPKVVFVRYSKLDKLEEICSTFDWWERFKNYYSLDKGGKDEQFDRALTKELDKVQLDLQMVGAIQTLENAFTEDDARPFSEQQIAKMKVLLKKLEASLDVLATNVRRS